MKATMKAKEYLIDIAFAVMAGVIVGTAYHFFQNSNGFAPGGVGGLATITHHLLGGRVSWSILMVAFNLPIFVLVSAFVNRKLGFMLSLYMVVQSSMPELYNLLGFGAYSAANNQEDFNIVFACIATGGISALIKKAKPETNIAYISFIMDACVVFVAFFVYGMKVTPVICTLINLFIANVVVDNGLSGLKNGYRFDIVTSQPNELSQELMAKLKHGVTEIKVHGMYTDTDKYMLVCIINKRQIGEMMKILKSHPDVFASFEKVNEVFGNFKRKV